MTADEIQENTGIEERLYTERRLEHSDQYVAGNWTRGCRRAASIRARTQA